MDEPQLQFEIALCCTENAPTCQRNNIFSITKKTTTMYFRARKSSQIKKQQHFISELIVVGKEEQQDEFQLKRSFNKI